MKLLKPAWVSHDKRSLFCVDIHPDGTRFATGGQGQDRTGTIAVWNMSPVECERAERDSKIPRQLCRMDDHLGCVNCLRWSSDGSRLASGGDDKLVMIWQHSKSGGGAVPFGGGQPVIEAWRAVATLRGHDGDVVDLSWAPRDALLATCSVDNLVLVWDAARWGDVLARLRGHTGLVKGVAWDPVGQYLCSQSDDRTLRVWRSSDWAAEAVVTEPFKQTGGTTAVLRCDWSPDGRYIVSAHAMNNGGPTALIIDRGEWTADMDFVGHKKAITCARFSGALLQRLSPSSTSASPSPGRRGGPYCACALGSRDHGVSVWLTNRKRPLVVVHELFDDSVMDLSWHPKRRLLIACSKDGTVAAMSFSPEELGEALSASEQLALQEKLYGRAVSLGRRPAGAPATPQLVESPLLLSAREQAEKAATAQKTSGEQGKPAATAAGTGQQGSAVKVERPAAVAAPGPGTPAATGTRKQIECRTPDGKRRITPMFVPSQDVTSESGPAPFSSGEERPFTSSTGTAATVMVERRDSVMAPQVAALASGEAVSPAAAAVPEATTIAVKRRPSTDLRMTTKRLHTSPPPVPPPAPVPALPPAGSAIYTDPGALVAPLPVASRLTAVMPAEGPEMPELSLAAEHGGETGVHLLVCRQGEQLRWRTVLSSPAVALRCAAGRCLVWSSDGTLLVLSRAGRLLLPPLAMPGRVARVAARGRHVLVVTCAAEVSTWDVSAAAARVRREPAGQLLRGGARLTGCSLTEDGRPVLVVSTGRAYLYSTQLAGWLLLTDGRAPGALVSEVQPQLPAAPASGQALSVIMAMVRRQRPAGAPATASALAADPSLAAEAAAAYLDTQVSAAAALGSPAEYSLWLSALVRQLAAGGDERRLRDLCERLLGPAHSGAALSDGPVAEMGLDGRTLLKELLPLLVPQLSLQRLYTEIKDQLDCVEMADTL